MIKNERQYRITKAQAERFREALRAPAPRSEIHPLLAKAQEEALRSQLESLEEEVAEYQALRSGQRRVACE